MQVVFPAPFGPNNPNISPSLISKLTFFSASILPYDFVISLKLIISLKFISELTTSVNYFHDGDLKQPLNLISFIIKITIKTKVFKTIATEMNFKLTQVLIINYQSFYQW